MQNSNINRVFLMGPIFSSCYLRFLFWILIGLLKGTRLGCWVTDVVCVPQIKWHILCHVFLYARPFSLTLLPDGPRYDVSSHQRNGANSNRWSPSKAELPSISALSSSSNCLWKRHMLYLKTCRLLLLIKHSIWIGCEFCGWLAINSMVPPVLSTVMLICP